MPRLILGLSLALLLFGCALLRAQPPIHASKKTVVWNLDNLESIGGHKVTLVGKPRVIETDRGKAIEFDGRKEG